MTINIFTRTGIVKIKDKQFQYGMFVKDNNDERFKQFLENNIPKTCGMINLYCDRAMSLSTVLDIVSYAHYIGASISIFTYDWTKIKKSDDWDKVNDYLEYKTHIVF